MEEKEIFKLFEEYLDQEHRDYKHEIKTKTKHLVLDFAELSKFSSDLADELLDNSEQTLKIFERVLENWVFGLEGLVNTQLTPVIQVSQLNLVNQTIPIPEYIIRDEHKVLYLLVVGKEPTTKQIADILWPNEKYSIQKVSRLIDRNPKDRNRTGLVIQGLIHPKDYNNLDYWKPTKQAITYLERLAQDYYNRDQEEKSINQSKQEYEIRIINLPKERILLIKDIRTKHLGKIYSIPGKFILMSDILPQAVSARFECPSCYSIINVCQTSQDFKEPSKCGCGRKGKFRLLSKELIDAQGAVLEEKTPDLTRNKNARINVILQKSLVDHKFSSVGKEILCTGILSEAPIYNRNGGKLTKFERYLNLNNIESHQSNEISLTKEDKKEILEFSKRPNLISEVNKLFVPDISGNYHIKTANLLQQVTDKRRQKRRINIHIFGIPGKGKTTLVKNMLRHAPQYIFATAGSTSSSVGLTGAVVKDEFTGGWSLQSGAIPLAGTGIILLDELDKLKKDSEQSEGISEGLSEMEISFDKATIHAKLEAPASVIGVGNTLDVDLDFEVVTPNVLKLSSHLVDRFDLIYKPDFVEEGVLVESITYQGSDEVIDEYKPNEFIRKYLFFAQSLSVPWIFPSKQKELLISLCQFLKKHDSFKDSDTRLIEAFNKLAHASAKLHLRTSICEEDLLLAGHLILRSYADRNIIQKDDLFYSSWKGVQ